MLAATDVKPLLNSVDFRTCVVFIHLNFRDRGDHLAQDQAARPDESLWILGRGVPLLHIVPMRWSSPRFLSCGYQGFYCGRQQMHH